MCSTLCVSKPFACVTRVFPCESECLIKLSLLYGQDDEDLNFQLPTSSPQITLPFVCFITLMLISFHISVPTTASAHAHVAAINRYF